MQRLAVENAAKSAAGRVVIERRRPGDRGHVVVEYCFRQFLIRPDLAGLKPCTNLGEIVRKLAWKANAALDR